MSNCGAPRPGKKNIYKYNVNPLSDMPILGSSNSAVNKDMMSKIWTNEDTIIWVENTEGKEEIVRYEQFLRFPQCFQRLCFVDASKWESME